MISRRCRDGNVTGIQGIPTRMSAPLGWLSVSFPLFRGGRGGASSDYRAKLTPRKFRSAGDPNERLRVAGVDEDKF